MNQKFKKELPGADSFFQPDYIPNYDGYPWDIRISLGEAPLEESYYFTVQDPEAIHLSIREVLEKFALNREQQGNLDVAQYPELPFLQEELILYFENGKTGQLGLEIFVNHNPSSNPVDLDDPVERYLGVCTFHDNSFDYRVLDLVFVAAVPDLEPEEAENLWEAYGHLSLLMLIDYKYRQGPQAFTTFTHESSWAGFFNKNTIGDPYPHFTAGMVRLEKEGMIRRFDDVRFGYPRSDMSAALELTPIGQEAIREIHEKEKLYAQTYDPFFSVSPSPPALDVPDGFDVRVQMMEYDNLDCVEAILLRILDDQEDEYFGGDQWANCIESVPFLLRVHEALAYKTHFSTEVLQSLKSLE